MDEVRVLDADEKQLTRPLWEQAFEEDSEEFLDYYYDRKCTGNIIYAVKKDGRYISMLHCNPYQLRIADGTVLADYIVGVATDKAFRHQGLMSALIRKALADMHDKGRAFAFLMPAAEAIYTPFGFRFIYGQPVSVKNAENLGLAKTPRTDNDSYQKMAEIRPLDYNDFTLAADIINRTLEPDYDIFTLKTKEYFEDLKQQYTSDGGDIFCIYRNGKPEAYFSCWLTRDEAEITEFISTGPEKDRLEDLAYDYFFRSFNVRRVILRGEKRTGCYYEKRIMARVTDVISMLKLVHADRPVRIRLTVIDGLVAGNNGVFLWQTGSISEAEKISDDIEQVGYVINESCGRPAECLDNQSRTSAEVTDCELKLTIEELAEWLFNGRCPADLEILKCVKTLDRVFINEIV